MGGNGQWIGVMEDRHRVDSGEKKKKKPGRWET